MVFHCHDCLRSRFYFSCFVIRTYFCSFLCWLTIVITVTRYCATVELELSTYFMLTRNNLNPDKSSPDKIEGNRFFLFVSNSTTTTLFDSEMGSPVLWGTKSIVILATAKNLPVLCRFRQVQIDIYKWIGNKFSFKGSYKGNNKEDQIRSFINRIAL